MRHQPDQHARTLPRRVSRRHVVVAAAAMAITVAGAAATASASEPGMAAGAAPLAGGGCERYDHNDRYPLRRCDSGDAVRVVQQSLLHIDPTLQVDGYYGLRTEEAVRVFQHSRGLAVDGLVGPNTWGSLAAGNAVGFDSNGSGVIDPWEIGTTAPPAPAPQPPVCASYRSDYAYPMQLCGRGEAIRIAQLALRDRVAPDLVADGYFGPATDTAVRQFQHAHGLTVDGLIAEETWRLLTDGYRYGWDENANGIVDPWEQGGVPPEGWC